MASNPAKALTEREAEIMGVVWGLGEATADQVRMGLADQPHDSTVRTLLRVLVAKGYLAQEMRGKAYVYRAAVAKANAQRKAVGDLLARFFGGSAEGLVLRLIEDERLTPERLDEIRRATEGERKPPKRGREGRES